MKEILQDIETRLTTLTLSLANTYIKIEEAKAGIEQNEKTVNSLKSTILELQNLKHAEEQREAARVAEFEAAKKKAEEAAVNPVK